MGGEGWREDFGGHILGYLDIGTGKEMGGEMGKPFFLKLNMVFNFKNVINSGTNQSSFCRSKHAECGAHEAWLCFRSVL